MIGCAGEPVHDTQVPRVRRGCREKPRYGMGREPRARHGIVVGWCVGWLKAYARRSPFRSVVGAVDRQSGR